MHNALALSLPPPITFLDLPGSPLTFGNGLVLSDFIFLRFSLFVSSFFCFVLAREEPRGSLSGIQLGDGGNGGGGVGFSTGRTLEIQLICHPLVTMVPDIRYVGRRGKTALD